MQNKFYLEVAHNYIPALENLNEVFPEMSDKAQEAVIKMMNALGFIYDLGDDEFIRIDDGVQSVWDIRKYGKKLITQKDLIKYINNLDGWCWCADDYTEEEIDEAVDAITDHPEYGKHLHQPNYVLDAGVEYLEHLDEFGDDDDDCETCPERDDCDCCHDADDDDDSSDDDPVDKVVIVHLSAEVTSPEDAEDTEKAEKGTGKKAEGKAENKVEKPEKKATDKKKATKAEKETEKSPNISKEDILDTVIALLKDLIED